MKRVLVVLGILMMSFSVEAQTNAIFVDPFIGTGKSDIFTKWGDYGGIYPGAVAPWGIAQLSPETSITTDQRGYYYSDSDVLFFTCMGHASGYPNGSAGRLRIMFYDKESVEKRTLDHNLEDASAGYYSLGFKEGDRVEATVTTRIGLFRYTAASDNFQVVFPAIGGAVISDNQTITIEPYRAVIKFNTPFSNSSIKDNRVTLDFNGQKGSQLLVKVCLSAVDTLGAIKNMEVEMPHWDFDRVRKQTFDQWSNELSSIDIDTSHKENATKFYTALYHSLLMPTIGSDVDKRYIKKGIIYTATGDNYHDDCSSWDTFRSLHPLLSLIKPSRQRDILRSWLEEYDHTGSLPIGPMTGFHTIDIFVDSYLKGITDFDTSKAYEAMKTCWIKGAAGTKEYARDGYVNDSVSLSVNLTLDYAFNDWTLSKAASLWGSKEEAKMYAERSFNYRNIFDPQTYFMLPRSVKKGTLRNMGEIGYQETDKWTATWFVPHNVQDLINLMGGDESFISHMQKGYDGGYMIHDNEPVMAYPYMFSYAGKPSLTAEYVSFVRDSSYRATPGGIPGNDDLGSMSSWYVFSSLGLFPVTPGQPSYVITSPLFSNAVIHLENGKKIEIKAEGHYKQKPYFSAITVDGVPHKKLHIAHADIADGALIDISRTTDSNSESENYERPFSIATERAEFVINSSEVETTTTSPNKDNHLIFTVENRGALGTFNADIICNSDKIAGKRLKINRGEIKKDTVTFRLYKAGLNKILFCGREYNITVKSSNKKDIIPVCMSLSGQTVIKSGSEFIVNVELKNITSNTIKGSAPLKITGQTAGNVEYTLSPGEVKSYDIKVKAGEPMLGEMSMLGVAKRIKVYDKGSESTVVDLDFNTKGNLALDKSGFENHSALFDGVTWIESGNGYSVNFDGYSYIEMPKTPSLDISGETVTMMAWINPRSGGDIFTKGDYTAFQMNRRGIAFFAGGWGRGYNLAAVGDNLKGNWHHVTGVCDGKFIHIYIDGRLISSVDIKGEMESTEIPWNLGRNAEMPFERNYKGEFDNVKIFKAALSAQEIEDIYKKEATQR